MDETASSDDDSNLGLAFILVSDLEPLNCDAVIASAEDFGLSLSLSPPNDDEDDESAEDDSPTITSFDLTTGETVFVMLLPVSHPDVEGMPVGPLSPDDMDSLINAPAHYIVTVMGMDGTVDENDIKMSAITSCVMAGCNPVGVLQMPGVLFHRPELFLECTKSAIEEQQIPMLICIDITAAQENDTHMSFLTHNMQRYGREEFYIVALSEGQGALDYTLSLVAWMLDDREYHLPTGDTVGRTADEKILVQRVPNPTGEGPEVIRLDLP